MSVLRSRWLRRCLPRPKSDCPRHRFCHAENRRIPLELFGQQYVCELNIRWLLSAKLHYTDTGYGHVVKHHQRTSSQQFYNLLYNKFTTNGQKFATSQHVDMSRCWALALRCAWRICCTTSGRIVVSLSVDGVVHVRSRCPRGVWHYTDAAVRLFRTVSHVELRNSLSAA